MPRPAKAAAGHFYGILSRFRHSRQAGIQPPPDAPVGGFHGVAEWVPQNIFLRNPFKVLRFLKNQRVRPQGNFVSYFTHSFSLVCVRMLPTGPARKTALPQYASHKNPASYRLDLLNRGENSPREGTGKRQKFVRLLSDFNPPPPFSK